MALISRGWQCDFIWNGISKVMDGLADLPQPQVLQMDWWTTGVNFISMYLQTM